VRPLPRLLAVTTDTICRSADFGLRAAAIAAGGPGVGLLVRAPESSAAQQAVFAERVSALARPPEAVVFVHARADLARAIGAQGITLRAGDLAPRDARRVMPLGWIGRSVHDLDEARTAIGEGSDFLLAGNLFETASHPDRPARGLEWLGSLVALGVPVLAIGGVTPERAASVRDAGGWGIAAITALWDAADPAAATTACLRPWAGGN
jgi:thiamine-phosphate pyrophosphorylase